MFNSQANTNAPKKSNQGEPKKESGREKNPAGTPFQDDQQGQQRGAGGGGERGLPAKDDQSSYPAI
jgi:hypothetical protein